LSPIATELDGRSCSATLSSRLVAKNHGSD